MKKHVSYEGKKVFIGLDVHQEFFVASSVSEGQLIKQCRMKPQSASVLSFIRSHYPGAEIKTCYEAGYSGFWLHRKLLAAGIANIVVHAAHVEVETNRVNLMARHPKINTF